MKGNKFLVIGVGKYGGSIARRLAEKGAEVYVFDDNEERIDLIKDEVALAVTLDATDKKALASQSVDDMDAAIVAIGENFEATILSTVHLMELGVKRIISRASGPQQRKILEKLGVTEILSPEDEVAFVVVERMLNPSILSFLQLPDDYEIAEIRAPRNIVGRTIADCGLRDKYELTLITVKRVFISEQGGVQVKEQHVLGVTKSDTVIQEQDTFVVFGTRKAVARFIEIND
jgi:trk system potassium uptake protein TrkA